MNNISPAIPEVAPIPFMRWAYGARQNWTASKTARRIPGRCISWDAPYFAKSSGPKICRISIVSPSSAGQRCAHFTTSSLDGASTSQ